MNRVGALYGRLTELFAEGGPLPDSELRPQTAGTIQARPEHFRADIGDGPYFLRTIGSRAEALALIDDVADQGEGDEDTPYSHFSTFLEMFDNWPVDGTAALDVPVDPSTRPRSDGGSDPGLITHERAAAWATIFNRHYRLLLGWLQHALLTPRADGREQRAVPAGVRRDAGAGRGRPAAGHVAPHGRGHRSGRRAVRAALHPRPARPGRRPLGPATATCWWTPGPTLLALPPSAGDEQVRTRLLATVAAAQNFVDVHGTGSGS